MSESEATAGMEESVPLEGEKVKVMNGVKEMEEKTEVKLQNGDSEKAQINGDIEKMDDAEMSEQDHNSKDDSLDNIAEPKLRQENSEELRPNSEAKAEPQLQNSEASANVESNDKGKELEESEKEVSESLPANDVTMAETTSESSKEPVETESPKDVETKDDDEPMEVDSSETVSKVNDESGKEEAKVEESDETKGDGEDSEKKEEKMETDEEPKEDKSESAEKSEVKEIENKEDKESESKKETGVKDESEPKVIETVKPKKTKKERNEEIQEVLPTRTLRTRRTPRKYTDDDDDIKIEKEVIKDDSSDIEMIEESDPLAISDADVKKAQLKVKKEIKGKDPNVIIIDTNTLLKNQGNLAAAVAQSSPSISVISAQSAPSTAMTSTSTSTISTGTGTGVSNVNIQTAIQAITGGVPAQGLQSAYITALQQVSKKDDAYVIEAPSFIVPYVMEGKPKEPIKAFLKRINKELDAYEKEKAAEEKKKKEEEGKKEKEKAEEEAKVLAKEKGEEEGDESKQEEKDKEKDEEKKEDSEKEESEKEESEETKKEEETVKEGEDKDKETKEEGEESTDTDKEKTTVDEAEAKEENKENKEVKEVKEVKDEKATESDKEKVEKEKVEKKEEDKSVSTDDNKENKEKSDTESVVDLENEEKEKKDQEDLAHLGKWEPYYRSTLGKFILDLGLNQAQEFLQSDLLRMQKKKLEKMKTAPSKETVISVKILERQLEITRKKNSHLRVPLKICKFCNFKTESEMVMDRHLESPHMVNYTYKCNFCEFETRGPQVILFHMEAEHNVRGRLERAPAFFQCSLCPYEDNNKSKMTRHSFSCSKKYKPEKNCELADWEPPAKIPKVTSFVHRGRPNTLGKAFEPVKMPNLLPKGLAGMNINLQSAVAANLLTTATANSAALAAGRGRGRPVGSYKTTGQIINQGRGGSPGSVLYSTRGVATGTGNLVQQVGGNTQQFTLGNQMFHSTGRVPRILPSSSASNVSLIPGLAASSSITIQARTPIRINPSPQSVQNKAGNTKSPQQPSISITPLPRGGQQPQTVSKGTTPTRDASGKPSFVICEICDGYIKDLEQLRNHMNLIHKVKIHPKMIYNRPPLNCQKCQHRFFTDQGLERHLLGTHGLVTSSMQEAANKGKDAGRCPICGKVFQWKLLNHVSRDHKMTLKPAHLSYKCTVCTATFNMYRLFENHVYSAHSVVNKNKGDANKKQGSGGSGSSDPPLKINDEITIIPQPATKGSKSDNSVSSGKKSGNSPSVSKEITITKVGSRPTRRSGGNSVEVISLDESPRKGDKRPNKDSAGNPTKKVRVSS